jgi:hypothetical protein
MIFNNFGQALRVSIGPYALLLLAAVAVFSSLEVIPTMLDVAAGRVAPERLVAFEGPFFLTIIGLAVFSVFVAAWVAVSWHRFILLEEYSGMLPAISGRPIWPYVGKSILLGFLIAILGLVIGMILWLVLTPLAGAGQAALDLGGAIISIILIAILWLVWFRIGVALPATAVGKPITLSEAWNATSKINGTIVGIVVIIAVVSFIAGTATQGLYGIHPALGFVVDIFVQWLNLMIGVSILTTLYGHVIEGRPLID